MRVSLRTAQLAYGGDLVVHTASSGAVAALDELYLVLADGETTAVGEVRTNIAYLNGYAGNDVIAAAVTAVAAMDWSRDPDLLIAEMPERAPRLLAPVRMLIDGALHDLAARRAGVPLAVFLGADEPTGAGVAHASNQTLFRSPPDVFLARAEAYVARGFRDLKVRLGAADFDEDLARLSGLRDRFGDGVKLSADVNGAWSFAEAPGRLERIAPFGLAYIEQPVPPSGVAGDLSAIARLAETSPVPIMLDESVASAADVAAIAALGGLLSAHLKLVKLGGAGPTVAAARQLAAAGAGFMIGQMNEGGAATAAALHVAAATNPDHAELYGADGLLADPAAGLSYADGRVIAPAAPGLGLGFDPTKTNLIREFTT